jgi:hypothetical protein
MKSKFYKKRFAIGILIVATFSLAIFYISHQATALPHINIDLSKNNKKVYKSPELKISKATLNNNTIKKFLTVEVATPIKDSKEDILKYIKDLRDDNIPRNALKADRKLRLLGEIVIPYLGTALKQEDPQQIKYASEILMSYATKHQLAKNLLVAFHELKLHSDSYEEQQYAANLLRALLKYPSSKLIEVTVEGLKSDNVKYNAIEGMKYLNRYIHASKSSLYDAVNTEDKQQKFLAAYILSTKLGFENPAYRKSFQILAARLTYNVTPHDASYSYDAIFKMGYGVKDMVEELLKKTKDDQQREILTALKEDFTNFQQKSKIARKKRMNTINFTNEEHLKRLLLFLDED